MPGEIPALAQEVDYCRQGTKQAHVLGKEALKYELTVHFGGLKLLKRKVVPTRAVSSDLAPSLNCTGKDG